MIFDNVLKIVVAGLLLVSVYFHGVGSLEALTIRQDLYTQAEEQLDSYKTIIGVFETPALDTKTDDLLVFMHELDDRLKDLL